ncbi:hypothetical protein OG21DRAFT_1508930 [Imleria badia]|nr:hypothetical protein OG21DRAFT_1508930 [Imleria badia]
MRSYIPQVEISEVMHALGLGILVEARVDSIFTTGRYVPSEPDTTSVSVYPRFPANLL